MIFDRISKVFQHQKIRIHRRGIKFFWAFIVNLTFFTLLLLVGQKYWPSFLAIFQGRQWMLIAFVIPSINLLNYLICVLVYQVVIRYNLFTKYMVTKDVSKLPWISNKEQWKRLCTRTIKFQFLNLILMNYGIAYLDSHQLTVSFSEQLPSFIDLITQIYFCISLDGLLFFLMHWAGHIYLYKLHKIHHQFQVAHPIATNHFHPIDYLLSVVIPFGLAVKILGPKMHFITLIVWTLYRGGEGVDGHSNYEFPWSPYRALPFGTSSEYHAFHHTHNVGNFGANILIQDSLAKQNQAFFQFIGKQKKQ